jgi:hypothetical protein
MLLCEGAPLLTLSASPVLASDYVYDISTSSAIGQYIGGGYIVTTATDAY